MDTKLPTCCGALAGRDRRSPLDRYIPSTSSTIAAARNSLAWTFVGPRRPRAPDCGEGTLWAGVGSGAAAWTAAGGAAATGGALGAAGAAAAALGRPTFI